MWPNAGIFDGAVVGLPGDETPQLLADLFAAVATERFVFEHEWQEGDGAIWSNWSVFHRREPFDSNERRDLRHLTVSEGGPQIEAA